MNFSSILIIIVVIQLALNVLAQRVFSVQNVQTNYTFRIVCAYKSNMLLNSHRLIKKLILIAAYKAILKAIIYVKNVMKLVQSVMDNLIVNVFAIYNYYDLFKNIIRY